jgi:hypothetical protein
MTKGAIYARYSSANQNATSIGDQPGSQTLHQSRYSCGSWYY